MRGQGHLFTSVKRKDGGQKLLYNLVQIHIFMLTFFSGNFLNKPKLLNIFYNLSMALRLKEQFFSPSSFLSLISFGLPPYFCSFD